MTQPDPADERSTDGPGPPVVNHDGEPLNVWERAGSTLLGLVFGGVGAWAVLTTENQAGSALLVVVGAAFLLMGIQGTALIRFGAGSNAVELQRRRRVQAAIDQVRHEENPDVAAGIVEAASVIEPALWESPEFQAEAYLTKVAQAIVAEGMPVTREMMDGKPDLAVHVPQGVVRVEIKYRARGPLILQSLRSAEQWAAGPSGVVVVTNRPLSRQIEAYNSDPANRGVEVVTWSDARDTPLLVRAILRMAAAHGRSESRES